MSLQYIIDGYNIINHPLFRQRINKKIKDQRSALLELIRRERLTGSSKNSVTVVFDGYPGLRYGHGNDANANLRVIFSGEESADERIKKMVESSRNPRDTAVVSDDKEIKFFVRAYAAKCLSIEEFMKPKKGSQKREEIVSEPGLSYSQRHAINQELKRLWLK
jgi:predicted RNA-binding protein with PIN domain